MILDTACYVGFYAVITLFLLMGAYHFGHYRGIMANVELATYEARRDAWMNGFQAGEDWQDKKWSTACNGA